VSGLCQPRRRACHPRPKFAVSEDDAVAIRAASNQAGGLSAVIEVRRQFSLIIDNAEVRACARTIAAGDRYWRSCRRRRVTIRPAVSRPVPTLRDRMVAEIEHVASAPVDGPEAMANDAFRPFGTAPRRTNG